jgi:hypothetical protein
MALSSFDGRPRAVFGGIPEGRGPAAGGTSASSDLNTPRGASPRLGFAPMKLRFGPYLSRTWRSAAVLTTRARLDDRRRARSNRSNRDSEAGLRWSAWRNASRATAIRSAQETADARRTAPTFAALTFIALPSACRVTATVGARATRPTTAADHEPT